MFDTTSAQAGRIRKGLAITTLGGLLFTLDLPLLRLSMADQWTMVFARGIFLFLSISFVWLAIRQVTGNKLRYLAGTTGLIVAGVSTLANITYIGAIVNTNAANVVFVIALIPVITAMLSRIFIKERTHPYTWLATFVALFGVGIIVWDGIHAGSWFGDILALISAFCTATALTIIRASGKNVATSFAIGSLCSAIIALLFFKVDPASLLNTSSFGMPALFWIGLNGLLAIPLASTLIANGPRFLPSADVSMFFLLETVLTPIWIWLLFAEIPSTMVLVGGCIVIVTLLAHSGWRLSQAWSSPPSAIP